MGIPHRGNSIAPHPDKPSVLELNDNQNLTSLGTRLDTSPYLAAGSDIVSVMTLDHQTHMVNLIIRLGWETRIAQQEGKLEAAQERLNSVADELVSYMVSAHEAKLYDTLVGSSTFAQSFAARGPRDKQGRSLRDFDLHHRLFKYPVSYMIYSEAFDGMPELDKRLVYQKLYDVLSGKNKGPGFAGLSVADRQAALEIVRDTKSNLPLYWK